MRALLPTLKEKKRYILFEIISKDKITKDECGDAINKSCKELLGTLGCAKAGISFLKETYKNNKGIILA